MPLGRPLTSAVWLLVRCEHAQFTMIEALQATLSHAGGGRPTEFFCPNCKKAAGPLTALDVSTAAEASGNLLVTFEEQMNASGIRALLLKLKDETLDGCVFGLRDLVADVGTLCVCA